jgi:F-type H+-transporting ATPase subunit b
MPQLDPTWFASQFFWIVVMFCVLYFVMAKISLPPVTKVLEERRNLIEGDIQKAMELKKEAEDALKSYEDALAGANAEARKMIADAKNEMSAIAAEKDKEMNAALEAKLRDSEKKLAESKQNALRDVRKMSEEIASAMVLKLTGTAPSEKDLEAALNEVIKEAV